MGFLPPDATHVKDENPGGGLAVRHVYRSAVLAATFPPESLKNIYTHQVYTPGILSWSCETDTTDYMNGPGIYMCTIGLDTL